MSQVLFEICDDSNNKEEDKLEYSTGIAHEPFSYSHKNDDSKADVVSSLNFYQWNKWIFPLAIPKDIGRYGI